jgi:uncharacterized RDD family membrane protein YckC
VKLANKAGRRRGYFREIGSMIASKTTGFVPAILSLALVGAYHILFVAKYGQTPGKMAAGIKIVKVDGRPVS